MGFLVQVGRCLESLNLVARCFPVVDLTMPGKNTSSREERVALIALWQRQLAGERAVRAAAAAAKRIGEPANPALG